MVQNIYKLKTRIGYMSSKAWKCYRCNLVFSDEYHAGLHQDLSKHSVREINMIRA